MTYYQLINSTVKEALGGLHSAKILLYSVDFAEIEDQQAKGDWELSAGLLSSIAQKLEKAGADFILICTNTMHKVAPQVQQSISIPLIHIAQAAADELTSQGIGKAALLGTKYTMSQDFYKDRLIQAGIEVLLPDSHDMELVNAVIYDELCLGRISAASRSEFQRIIAGLENSGAQAVVLGCTEIGLLLSQKDVNLPLFDTTVIHAKAAVKHMLS